MALATLGKLKGCQLRPTQEQAVKFIKGSDKNFVAVRGPTGIGKTCLGFESVKPPFYYVCSSIQLQEQAIKDYPEAAVLKGRSNYYCHKYGTADLCLQNKPCENCEYNHAKAIAIATPMTILNFHYFLNITNFTQSLPPRNLIIDEADDLENVLVGFISLDFALERLKSYGIFVTKPTKKTVIAVMPQWIETVMQNAVRISDSLGTTVKEIMQRLKFEYRQPTKAETIKLKKYKSLQTLLWKLRFLSRQDLNENWIYKFDERKNSVILKPKWLTRDMTDTFLFSKCENLLFMSATIPSKEVFCGLYGLEGEELDYIDLPNVWESNKRKIIYRPRVNLRNAEMSKPETIVKVRNAVVEIANEFEGRGVIHCVSFKLGEMIMGISNHGVRDRLLLHGYTDKNTVYEEFKKRKNAIFVSPSSTRGLDLADDLCEFIIWLKAPFLYLGDPQVSARVNASGKFGKEWYASDACQTIIQGCGRGFRHENDYCTTYLIDEQIGRLITKQAKLFPMWFRDLIIFDYEDSNDSFNE